MTTAAFSELPEGAVQVYDLLHTNVSDDVALEKSRILTFDSVVLDLASLFSWLATFYILLSELTTFNNRLGTLSTFDNQLL